MDKMFKYALNKELLKIGELPYDCGDEWTELMERVFKKLISVREKKHRAEVERLRALLREECSKHDEDCTCRSCEEAFR